MADLKMNKQKKEYIIAGVLLLAAIVIGVSKFSKDKGVIAGSSESEFDEKWKEIEMLEKEVPVKEEGIVYETKNNRDPFMSPFESEKGEEEELEEISLPDLKFEGMVWGSFRPQAIINNKVYDIGNSISVGESDSITIINISREGIFLLYRGKRFVVNP